MRECEVRRDTVVRAARRGTAGESAIRMQRLFLPNQGNVTCYLWHHIVG